MAPRTFTYNTNLSTLGKELLFTIARLRAYPFLSAYAEQFEAMFANWLALMQRRYQLELAELIAVAATIVVDDQFNFLAKAIAKALDAITGDNRQAKEFTFYFGNQRPSDLCRPILGEQLETMRRWPPTLIVHEGSQDLQKAGTELEARVVQADAVVAALAKAKEDITLFEYGPFTQFIDALNALRNRTYGELGELYHSAAEAQKHAEGPATKGKGKGKGKAGAEPLATDEQVIKNRLPRDFASRFFIRESNTRQPTIADMQENVMKLRADLEKAEQQLNEAIERDHNQENSRLQAELNEADEELVKLDEKRAQIEARRAALEAKRKRPKPAAQR